MKYRFTPILFIFWSLFFTQHVFCAPSTEKKNISELKRANSEYQIKLELIKEGFKNVAILLDDEQAIITYENMHYRYELRAVKKVIRLVIPLLQEKESILLIPQNRKIPLVLITVPVKKYLDFYDERISNNDFVKVIDISFKVDPTWKKIRKKPRENNSSYTFDFIVHPQLKAQFGNYDDPVESQLNLVPELGTSLWPGMRLSAQLIIPVHNELNEKDNYFRPGILTLNQTFRLPKNTFLSTSAGYFTHNRYGADLELKKYHSNGLWSIGAKIGFTGTASYSKGVWFYTPLNDYTTLLNAEYRLPQYDLSFKITVGQYLFRDKGLRFDMMREFGEVKIGFFALKTEQGRNGGFKFSVPLFPKKYPSKKWIRIHPAKDFAWEYRYRGLQLGGTEYSAGNEIEEFIELLNPAFVKSQFSKRLNLQNVN